MIAEIHNKVNSANSNLTERSEDELTGNFFGNLRYLPFDKGLGYVLKNCVYPHDVFPVLDRLDADGWPERVITFWPREYAEAEPDVLLSFGNAVIIVEVKFNSGLSDANNADNSIDSEQQEESRHQLARESRLLQRIAAGTEKLLLLLAPQKSAHSIYSGFMDEKLLPDGVAFGYMTWQKAFDAIKEISRTNLNTYEKAIVQDLVELLKKKGFEGFRSFEVRNSPPDTEKTWSFAYTAQTAFSFTTAKTIERGVHYDFG